MRPISKLTVPCIALVSSFIWPASSSLIFGKLASVPFVMPGNIHRPTSFAKTFDGDAIPRALFALSTSPHNWLWIVLYRPPIAPEIPDAIPPMIFAPMDTIWPGMPDAIETIVDAILLMALAAVLTILPPQDAT